jgi:hypothetical protein
MVKEFKNLLKVAFAIILILSLSENILAQPLWLDLNQEKSIAFEFLKPDFENIEDLTFFTSAMFLSGRFSTSKKLFVIGEIPFANYGRDSNSNGDESELAFGNPYLGLEIHNEKGNFFGEVGFRLPLAPKDDKRSALIIGALTDFVERVEAFTPEIIPFNLVANYHSINENSLGVRLRAGLVGWISTGDRDENEWHLVYSVSGGYQTSNVNVLVGLSGRYWLSTDADFSDSIFNQFVATANFNAGSVQPGVIFKIPLSENLQDMVNLVFGLSLGFNLN